MKLVKTEIQKMKHCQILLIGIIGLALCPLVQLGGQYVMDEAYREPNFDFAKLFGAVVWGNTQIFLPIALVMIGGWMIDRERTQDTLKNVLAVPIGLPLLLAGKLAVVVLLTAAFAVYSMAATLAVGLAAGLPGLNTAVLAAGAVQILLAALGTCIAALPLVVLFGRLPGAYLGGSVLAFLFGYSILFFKGGLLRNIHPFLAALNLAGFDTADYSGTTAPPDLLLSALALVGMLLLAALFVCWPQAKDTPRKAKAKPRPGARRGGRSAHRF